MVTSKMSSRISHYAIHILVKSTLILAQQQMNSSGKLDLNLQGPFFIHFCEESTFV